MNHFIQCPNQSHQGENVNLFCIKRECQYKYKFLCCQCLTENDFKHAHDHKDFIISITQLLNSQTCIKLANDPNIQQIVDFCKNREIIRDCPHQIDIIYQIYEKLKNDLTSEIDKIRDDKIEQLKDLHYKIIPQIQKEIDQICDTKNLKAIINNLIDENSTIKQTTQQIDQYLANHQIEIQDKLKMIKKEYKKFNLQVENIVQQNDILVNQLQNSLKQILQQNNQQLFGYQSQVFKDQKEQQLDIFQIYQNQNDMGKDQFWIDLNLIDQDLFKQGDRPYVNFINNYHGDVQERNDSQLIIIYQRFIRFKCSSHIYDLYCISEKLKKQDKIFIKLKLFGNIKNVYFILGPCIEGRQIQDLIKQKLYTTTNKGSQFDILKETYTYKDLYQNQYEAIIYIYINIANNKFIMQDEKKEMIYTCRQQFQDSEHYHFGIASKRQKCKVEIMTFYKI